MSVLTGREPTALTTTLSAAQDLPALPQIIAVGNPADLLRRRRDIRAAERELAAVHRAHRRSGCGPVPARHLHRQSRLCGRQRRATSATPARGTRLIAPGISWAAFDLGRVRAQIAGARARTDGSLARYEQTVLRALEETEDALVTHARSRERLEHVADSARPAARPPARTGPLRRRNGRLPAVLDAERTQLAAEDSLAQSRTDTATSLIAVYKALGGGWQDAPLAGETAACGHIPRVRARLAAQVRPRRSA